MWPTGKAGEKKTMKRVLVRQTRQTNGKLANERFEDVREKPGKKKKGAEVTAETIAS